MSYVIITFGLALYTFAWSAFMLPCKIISGGVTGLSSIVYFLLGIPMGITSFVINLIFLLLGFKFLGAKFGINTIYGIVMSSVFLIMWQQGLHVENLFDVKQFGDFMCSLIGGALCGIGIGLTFNNGGNSGGTDIIALILSKYYPISPGRVILLIDVVIIGCGFFVSHQLEKIVFGYIVMITMTYVLDMVIDGNKQNYQITVFSQKTDEIGETITKEVGRGATLLEARGCYTKEPQQVLMVLVHRTDRAQVLQLIHRIDPDAFISINKAEGVYGKNFEKLKL
ncbi:MAG: YitT family protein [Bacteroidales bacterium]|nr:YitT family protein [Bacteroidales bacterium]